MIEKQKALLVDADNVLLNWYANIHLYNEENGLPFEHVLEMAKENTYSCVTKLFPTSSYEESLAHLYKYNESEYTRELPVFEDGSERILSDLSSDHKIIVVTLFGEKEISKINRRYNLELVFGDIFEEIYSLDLSACKESLLAELNNQYDVKMWVDDKLENVKKGLSAGIKNSYQYTHRMKCGRNTGEVPEMESWKKIYNFIRN